MRPIDADDLIERMRNSEIKGKRSAIELVKESKTILNFSKITEKHENLKEG